MSGGGNEGLWVRSDVLPTGVYGVSINVGDDRAWTLPPDRAVRYAATCVRRATEAEHDAAVLSFLTAPSKAGLDLPDETAAGLIAHDLRPDRAIDHSETEPLRFHVAIGARTRKPFLRMELDGNDAGELTPADLRDHAMGVLQTLAAADLDAALVRCMVSTVGTDENRARGMVEALQQHWPAEEKPRSNL